MKSLRIIGSFLFALVLAASVLAPAEVAALVPPSAHDFFFGPEGVTLATVTFTGISRKARGLSNLGGIKQIILFAEGDFTADWPLKEDIVDGILSEAPPLKVGVVGAVLKFDNNTARVKSNRKGELGYQNVGVDGEGKFAGYEAAQLAAIEKTFNQGGVAIATYKDGTRSVVGTSYEPLVFEDTTDSGAKADDKLQIDFKFKGDGYDFHPPILASSVTIPLPA
ncbi:hypothetical protein [Spirosoma sp.]|uniref:hypothetical protein n=1 Tax=Spirosoma sp. TaxID=1899569 RepID=UPI00262D5062|nr:hypothetical protein [Spirosoma sp.]MCX6216384.1 hypothetical protein [Spirosoma sp.]